MKEKKCSLLYKVIRLATSGDATKNRYHVVSDVALLANHT
jgi:hypothetical protein